MSIEDYTAEVRRFVEEEYVGALFKGNALDTEEKDALAEKIAAYTGLSKEFVLSHNLRITGDDFCMGLLADDHLAVGRLDGRFTGPVTGSSFGDGTDDPSDAATEIVFSAAVNTLFTDELGLQVDRPYISMNNDLEPTWTWMGENAYVNQEDTLYKAISHNAFLKVWVLCGYYDLATPFYASEWVYRHVFLKDADSDRMQFTYYPSGHMIYLNDEACARFHQEAEDWFRN